MSTTKQETRTRAPRYDIFRRAASESTESMWTLIAQDVAADNRKAAIGRATAGLEDVDRYGTFAAVRSGEFKVLTRSKRVVEADDWS